MGEKLARFIRNHQYTCAELERRTQASFGRGYKIIIHGSTRFAGFYYCAKRLLMLRSVLREMLVSAEFEDRNIDGADGAVAIANNAGFWSDLAKYRKFMKPLKCLIKLHDHDCHTTHQMYPSMYKVEELWRANTAGVPSAFKNHALKEHKARWQWMTFDIHTATYAMAPEYHRDNVYDNNPVMAALKRIIRFYAETAADANAAIAEFRPFKSATGPEFAYDDASFKTMSPRAWWQLNGSRWPKLQKIALRAFAVGTSSSTSERNFSTFGHLWTQRANSLDFSTILKLVFCYYNIRALQKCRDGTHRVPTVEHGWMVREVDSDDEEQ